jgi:uncharacterized RDD family membrane protein YckC
MGPDVGARAKNEEGSEMSELVWHHEVGGSQVTVSHAAIAEAIRLGQLAARSRVWRAGMVDWQPWESVPELAALARPPPIDGRPPVPAAPAGAVPPVIKGSSISPIGSTAALPIPGNSYAADVLTGAGAAPLYAKAPLGARFVAALLDNLLSSVPAIIFVVVAIIMERGSGGVALVFGLLAVAALIWAIYYSFTKDGRPGGQSIGKKTMGLMVVHLPTNRPCSSGQSALRYLVLLGLNLIPYVGWLVEPIVTLAAAGGRRLGDSAAGTQVIALADYRPLSGAPSST